MKNKNVKRNAQWFFRRLFLDLIESAKLLSLCLFVLGFIFDVPIQDKTGLSNMDTLVLLILFVCLKLLFITLKFDEET
jgi:hypothetical protein